MSLTPDFDPDDTIVSVGNRKIVNVPKYIVGILRDNWDTTNTDGHLPDIDVSTEHKVRQFRPNDTWVTIYRVSEINSPNAIGYDWRSKTVTFTVDIFSGVSYDHLVKMEAEARRVIDNYRKDTFGSVTAVSGRVWAEWGIRSSSYDRTSKLFYRVTVDCKLNWRYEKIKNT